MDYLSLVIYGVIQGVTEFLPVSSSGHLALLPHFLEINDPGVAFDLSMHVGTALSVIIYFKRQLLEITSNFFNLKSKKDPYVINLILSTLMSILFIFLLKKWASDFGRSTFMIAMNLMVFGIFLWLVDRFIKQSSKHSIDKNIMWSASFFIGFMQALAIFPGVSRSGITITACRMFKFTRDQSTSFSFLLSLPVILGGFFFKLPELMGNPIIDFTDCLIGAGVSFFTGIMAIHFLIKMVNKIGFLGFAVYRVILALLILFTLGNA